MGSKKGVFAPQWKKLYHIPWILTHFRYYILLNTQILRKGIPITELLVLKYPFSIPDLKKPPILSIDVTDACDLECEYCNNPLFPHPRTMMKDETFQHIADQVKTYRISRIRFGGGEPTLHPYLNRFVSDVRPYVKHISVTTNGQWKNMDIAKALIYAKPDVVEISVDAGGKEVYERSRSHASYERLMDNLASLRAWRDQNKAKTLLKTRLMLRPSTMHLEREETGKLLKYVDIVIPQWLLQHPETPAITDVFQHRSIAEGSIPICTVPFKDMQIRPDGRIPVCPFKGCSLDTDKQVFLGDITTDSLVDLWNCRIMTDLRKAHRNRKGEILEGCRNCHN